MKALLFACLAVMAGCATTDNRICLDWKVRTEIREKCIPFYGQMICADEERTTHQCILYEEEDYETDIRSRVQRP